MSNERALHPAAWPEERLLAECDVRRQRRSGPGGQHRNKVETGVVVTHRPTGVVGEATETRSQERNRRNAVHRLRVQLAVRVRSPIEQREPIGPSELWRRRCRGRIEVSPDHDDFPALLAEALDAIDAREAKLPETATFLGCSASQLVKFLKSEPAAFGWLNDLRAARGLRALS